MVVGNPRSSKLMSTIWWGDFKFAEDETRLWQLGPLNMWVTRRAAEIQVALLRDPALDPPGIIAGDPWHDPVDESAELVRYGLSGAASQLEITPATADRAAIVKSQTTYIVPPGGSTTAFVSSPAWVRIGLPRSREPFHEAPTTRPSDTWFGPSTIEGELCYAIRTSVRYNLNNLPVRPHRAVSVIRIQNHADTPLPLARLRLPMPYLSLFQDDDGRLWTEAVTLDRRSDSDIAEIKLGKGAPREAGHCLKVSGPREKMGKRHLIRSFTGLLGLSKGREGFERIVE
jgi:hypothetical protein